MAVGVDTGAVRNPEPLYSVQDFSSKCRHGATCYADQSLDRRGASICHVPSRWGFVCQHLPAWELLSGEVWWQER